MVVPAHHGPVTTASRPRNRPAGPTHARAAPRCALTIRPLPLCVPVFRLG